MGATAAPEQLCEKHLGTAAAAEVEKKKEGERDTLGKGSGRSRPGDCFDMSRLWLSN